ncbi:MAG: TIGR01777 family oxidoreductase [Candidatus Promineifilaceae bacterium]
MRIVIAGGTGLIGRALVEDLVGAGHDIVVLSRNSAVQSSTFPEGVQLAQWDASEIGDWSRLVDGSDVVVNFAGENIAGERFLPGRWTEAKKRLLKSSRVDAGEVISRSIAEANARPRALIQASAVGYYGPRGDEIVTESTSAGYDYLAKLCAAWEESSEGVEQHGVRRVILRTGLVLSTRGGPLPRLIKQYRLFAGGPFGNGEQYWPWIHLDDVVGAIRFLMEDDSANGPFNVTSPTPVTNRQFSKAFGRVLGRPSFWPIPAFVMKLLVGEVSVVVLKGQRAIPEKLNSLGFYFEFSDLGAALEDVMGR